MKQRTEEKLKALAKKLEISLGEKKIELLRKFGEITQTTNCQFNLVSRKGSQEELITNQILDSFLWQPIIRNTDPKKILDLGSGGGFPGVPLSILNPEISFDLLDSSGKRFNHLLNIKIRLGLTNSNPIHERAENLVKIPQYEGLYDLITARAVTNISTLVRWARSLAKPDGVLLTTLGEAKVDELWRLIEDEGMLKGIQIRSVDGGVGKKKRSRLIWVRVARL